MCESYLHEKKGKENKTFIHILEKNVRLSSDCLYYKAMFKCVISA